MDPLSPGDPRQVGKYVLAGRLGAGGMGQVFLGRSPGGRPVAVKLIHPGHATDGEFRRRFRAEVEAARKVGGFHTAPVVDADPDPDTGSPWMATAYIPGPTLFDAVDQKGPLPADSVVTLGAGLAEGLVAIHACELIHRDLKPSNVILAVDGPRVIDFGVAKALDRMGDTTAGAVIGTLAYMSPEQARGADVGPATDVYSLGAVLAFAACGAGPGTSPDAMARRLRAGDPALPVLPAELRTFIADCLAEDPGARPRVSAVLAALVEMEPFAAPPGGWLPSPVLQMINDREEGLRRALPAGGQTTIDPPRPSPPEPDGGRRRFLLAVAASVGAASLTGGGVGLWLQQRPEPPEPVFGGGWEELFANREIQRVFHGNGLDVEVNNISGIDMTYIRGASLNRYDFFLCPADSVAAVVKGNFRAAGHLPSNPELILQDRMVVLVHKALLDCLENESVVRTQDGYHVFDVLQYLDKRLNEKNWTWGRIKGPEQFTQRDSQVEVVSGAPCAAGGGDLYFSLLLHAHGKKYRTDEGRLIRDLEPLFRNSWPLSSFGLLQEFFSSPQYPMAFVYEHDVLKYLAGQQGIRKADYRLLYPDPGVLSKHLFLARRGGGEAGAALVGRLLTSSKVQRVMAQTFFLRGVGGENIFEDIVAEHGLAACIREGGASPDLPIPSDIAPFPRPNLMVQLRREIVRCSA